MNNLWSNGAKSSMILARYHSEREILIPDASTPWFPITFPWLLFGLFHVSNYIDWVVFFLVESRLQAMHSSILFHLLVEFWILRKCFNALHVSIISSSSSSCTLHCMELQGKSEACYGAKFPASKFFYRPKQWRKTFSCLFIPYQGLTLTRKNPCIICPDDTETLWQDTKKGWKLSCHVKALFQHATLIFPYSKWPRKI